MDSHLSERTGKKSDSTVRGWSDVALEPNVQPAGIRRLYLPVTQTKRRLSRKRAAETRRSWRKECGLCLYGIYSLVFIVETMAAKFGASRWLDGDLRGTKQLRAVSHTGGEKNSYRSGA